MDTVNIYGRNAVSAALNQKRPDLVYCVVAVGRLYTALVVKRLMQQNNRPWTSNFSSWPQ